MKKTRRLSSVALELHGGGAGDFGLAGLAVEICANMRWRLTETTVASLWYR
jgi:hypothetical protein